MSRKRDASQNDEDAANNNNGEQPPRNLIIKTWDGFKKRPAAWITAGATVALAGLALAAWLEAIAARNIAQRQLVAGSAAFVFWRRPISFQIRLVRVQFGGSFLDLETAVKPQLLIFASTSILPSFQTESCQMGTI